MNNYYRRICTNPNIFRNAAIAIFSNDGVFLIDKWLFTDLHKSNKECQYTGQSFKRVQSIAGQKRKAFFSLMYYKTPFNDSTVQTIIIIYSHGRIFTFRLSANNVIVRQEDNAQFKISHDNMLSH